MTNFEDVISNFNTDVDEAVTWMSSQYDTHFGKWFQSIREFHSRISDTSKPITDDELSHILMNVPLDMIECSEALNTVRLKKSLLKLSAKKKKSEDSEYDTYEDDVMLAILDCLINRVDKEMSFARELIMSAKKIWDGRRLTESMNPTDCSTSVDSLPEYDGESIRHKNRYIK